MPHSASFPYDPFPSIQPLIIMPYKPFEEYTLWQNLAHLHLHLDHCLAPLQAGISPSVRVSLLNASLRASQRLAEGLETTFGPDQLPHLQQVRAALVEVRNGLSLLQLQNPQSPQLRELQPLMEETSVCSRMLHVWIENHKNPGKRKASASEDGPAAPSGPPQRSPDRSRPAPPASTYRPGGPQTRAGN